MSNLRSFKTEQDAAKMAEQMGYTVNVSHLYKDQSSKCECGESGIAVFEDLKGKEIRFVICQGCGEEY